MRRILCATTVALLFFAIISLGAGQPPNLFASPAAVNPADKITVVYSGAPGFDTDWIAIYRIGAANERYGEWRYLRGEKSGTLTFAAPQELGEYEFRMFKNWAGSGSYEEIARSNTFAVVSLGAGEPPIPDGRPNIQIVTQAVDPATNRVYYSYNQQGLQIFKIKVLVAGPELFRIRSVHYQLHQTFSPSERTMTNPRNNFELELWTWGAFNMPITVTMTDGRAYRYDYGFTFGDQLRDAQKRGVPFVRVG